MPVAGGNLRIEVDAYALVLIDGELKGSFDAGVPLQVPGLAGGRHLLEASPLESGYAPAALTVELKPDEPLVVALHLEPTPERAELRLNLQSDERRQVRQQLRTLGHPCDPASDRFDRGFRVVLREFQRQSKLPATGYLTPETRALLERRVVEQKRSEPPPGTVPRPGGEYIKIPDRPRQQYMIDRDPP